jgi:hypothetical protein
MSGWLNRQYSCRIKIFFMKNFSSISKSDRLKNFLAGADVEDLTAAAISGGAALASVQSAARAYGQHTYTGTNAVTTARPLGRKGSIAIGRGSAVAVGDRSAAEVNVFGIGDKVIEQTGHLSFDNGTTIARGLVVAIDYH